MLQESSVTYTSVPQNEDEPIATSSRTFVAARNPTHSARDCYIAAGSIIIIVLVASSVAAVLTFVVSDSDTIDLPFSANMHAMNNDFFSSKPSITNDYEDKKIDLMGENPDQDIKIDQNDIPTEVTGSIFQMNLSDILQKAITPAFNESVYGGVSLSIITDNQGNNESLNSSISDVANGEGNKTDDNMTIGVDESPTIDSGANIEKVNF